MEALIEERKEEIIDEFSMYEDWMDKYEYIIDLGKELPALADDYKTPENLIKGCQSQVWLTAKKEEGLVHFMADSDAIITKGLVAMMVKVFSGSTASDIISADVSFLEEIGLKEHLSPNRSNGLTSMIKQMKMYALAFKE